ADVFVPLDLNWRRTYYRSSLKKRALAYLIDIFITSVPAVIIGSFLWVVILPLAFDMKTIEGWDDEDLGLATVIWWIVFIAFATAFMESSRGKGTFGKRIMNIEITDSYGRRISFGKSLVRNILKAISTLLYTLVIPLIIQFIIFPRTKQLFHDKFSNTIVGERLGRLK
ncbi:MAG: RDD family protein, partial [Flavobacterium sp.]